MKKLVAVSLLALVAAMPAFARNTPVTVTLQSVLDMPEAQGKLDGSVKFYLAGAPTPKVIKKFGEDTSNAKTNAFNKSAEEACRWNALSALIKLQDKARREGANAVIEITSYSEKVAFSSPTDIQCSDGAFLAGIALKGTYATVGK
ncbi:MAG TPA: excinuclease ATPase subunit [Burkholderiaceae bacterium]